MAIENLYGSAHPKGVSGLLDARRTGLAKTAAVVSTVEVPAAADAGSKIRLARVASNTILLPGSTLFFDAFGVGATADLGTEAAAAFLINDVATAAAGSGNAIAAVNVADYGKELWELAGLTADPGGELDIVLTAATAHVNAGTYTLHLMTAVY